MSVRFVFLLLILPACWMPASAADPRVSEELQTKLDTPVQNYSLSANSFVEGLVRVASDFRVPMGIEWVNAPAAKAALTLSWKKATVREVIALIVSTQPSYRMEVRSNVVHIHSPKLIRKPENILKLRIAEFAVHNEYVDVASWKLRDLVKSIVFRPKPQPQRGRGGIAVSGAATLELPKVSLSLRDVTLEDVLDALAVASSRKVWVVTFSDDRTLTPAGYRRTLTLWNSSPIPDAEQPVWNLFHWGDVIPSAVLGRK